MAFGTFFRKTTGVRYLSIALPVMAVEWIVFKCLYPYADYFTDSYSYLEAAANRDVIGYRPIGYSIFLRMVHAIWVSDTFLVTLQYVLVQGACLGLLLFLRRRCGLPAGAVWIILACMLLNPSIAYLCNYVSSDALFVGLSLIWLTVLMGLLREPSWWRLWLQVALLFVIFNLRFVAMFYPAVAALAFMLMRVRGQVLLKLTGIVASIGIVLGCAGWIKHLNYKITGANVFSAFSGWQIANNALDMYLYIPVDTADLPSAECRELAADVQAYFLKPRMPGDIGTEYMWTQSSPLHQYRTDYQRNYHVGYFDAWYRVAPVFSQYGYLMVRRHPVAFAKYYGYPSARSFFLAPLDVFGVYNEGHSSFEPVAKHWFNYRSLQARVWSATIQGGLMAPMPWIYLLLNIGFTMTTLLFLRSGSCRERHPLFTVCVKLVAAYLLANACFTIFASPTVFRYQLLPMVLLFVFMISQIYFLTFRDDPSATARWLRDGSLPSSGE